jgi:hypothetical protein
MSTMLTPEDLTALRRLVARAEQLAPTPHQPAPEPDELHAGDVAQIRPFAHRTFEGMLFCVGAASPYEVKGYLLRPHRGGCREAWLTFNHHELERVGRTWWPDPEFARRRACFNSERCPRTGR